MMLTKQNMKWYSNSFDFIILYLDMMLTKQNMKWYSNSSDFIILLSGYDVDKTEYEIVQ